MINILLSFRSSQETSPQRQSSTHIQAHEQGAQSSTGGTLAGESREYGLMRSRNDSVCHRESINYTRRRVSHGPRNHPLIPTAPPEEQICMKLRSGRVK